MAILSVIGNGYVGGNLADYLEKKHTVIRYSLEDTSREDDLSNAEVTFVCVPTPTDFYGFNADALWDVMPKTARIVVIKSTVLPKVIYDIQEEYRDKVVLHAPEFLREKTAKQDTLNPERNIIGITRKSHKAVAEYVLSLLPPAKYQRVCSATEAALSKYTGNLFLINKVVFFNMVYDLCTQTGADFETVRSIISHDSRIGESHTNVTNNNRGAGGNCLPKDIAAFSQEYPTPLIELLEILNTNYLSRSNKDIAILNKIYKK